MTGDMKRFRVLIGVLPCAVMFQTPTRAVTCAEISESQTRNICLAQGRRSYGVRLERELSQRGVDASVFVEETGDPGSGAYPRLIVWTRLAQKQPYALNSEFKILEGARHVGFRTLVYVDKGEESNWYFDLLRPGRAALDVVPWQKPPWK
jgi:hypothetical protein